MATLRKPIGKRGQRWEARVRKAYTPTLTQTFAKKSDAQEWAAETERAITLGLVDTNSPLAHTSVELID